MDKTALRTAAAKYGTPLYLFDLEAFTARAQRVRAAFGSDVNLCYSMKANPFVLRGLPDVFRWVEVCSPGELTICERLGIPPERILYSGVNKGADDVARAVALGADPLTAESTLHFDLICAAAATALPMLARSNASTAAAQSADTANETDGSGADAAMPADAAPAEEPESAAEQRAKADRSMLYTMESASEAGAASYNVSADELGRFVEMLSDGASESAMPEAAADESCVVGSEYNNVCVYIYGGRVLYSTDGGETVYESAVSAEGVNEILAFFAG